MSSELEQRIAGLRRMSREQLKNAWRDLYRAAPPVAFTPDVLARGIAWRLQEKEQGGLQLEARRLVGGSGEAVPRRRRSSARVSLRPGNRLVRRWRGRTYVVEVTDGGLMYDGARYPSLSVIASKITGTRWSGPKFFGLVT
jgi:hypothetical protein